MGQRTTSVTPRKAAPKRSRSSDSASGLWLSTFATDLGWMGILGRDGRLIRLTLGHFSAENVRNALTSVDDDGCDDRLDVESASPSITEGDWHPELRRQLEQFALGERVDFRKCPVELPAMTAFQKRIIEQTRRIPYGKTLSYSEVATRAGSPGAARAVGNVMRSNRIPLIIPCHRVVAACGLGGYSAPQGLDLKRKLLELESRG
ncbi:MAG: MGMT family protein [Planctomycetaceae bacterium]|nr:MGMT family protein [Planctomycetaceae bacterium]